MVIDLFETVLITFQIADAAKRYMKLATEGWASIAGLMVVGPTVFGGFWGGQWRGRLSGG
jgi:hypothetical protein